MVSKIELTPTQAVTARFVKAVDSLVGRREGKKITLADIAEKLGMHSSNITRMRGSKTHSPTPGAMFLLCKEYGISGTWLLEGIGHMMKSDTAEIEQLQSAVSALNKQVDFIKAKFKEFDINSEKKVRRKKGHQI